jgi:hypothetical protein
VVANIGVALKLQISQRTKSGTFARHTKPTHKSQPCKRACLVPTLPGHTLLRWTHTFNSSYQDEGRTYNIGVVRHPIEHPKHIQTSMTLPTRPQRTKSGTFARHTKPTHKSQPCKRACLVPTHSPPTSADGILIGFN